MSPEVRQLLRTFGMRISRPKQMNALSGDHAVGCGWSAADKFLPMIDSEYGTNSIIA